MKSLYEVTLHRGFFIRDPSRFLLGTALSVAIAASGALAETSGPVLWVLGSSLAGSGIHYVTSWLSRDTSMGHSCSLSFTCSVHAFLFVLFLLASSLSFAVARDFAAR